MRSLCLTFFAFFALSPLAFAAELPLPYGHADRSCNLSSVERPSVEANVELIPGLVSDVSLRRTVVFHRKREQDGSRYIESVETGQIGLQTSALSDIIRHSADSMRSNAGETCQFSISTMTGSASWAIPPTFSFYADGKGRKCTRFDYPCGPPEFRCEIRWDYQKCDTWMKMCEALQKFDIGNWSAKTSGTLPLSASQDGQSIEIDASAGQPIIDTSGSGEIAQLLDAVGLLRALGNIDTSLRVNVNLNIFPTFGRLISIVAPADPTATPTLVSASWSKLSDTAAGKFADVGISYSQVARLKPDLGCLVAQCLRKSKTDDDFNRCVLLKESR